MVRPTNASLDASPAKTGENAAFDLIHVGTLLEFSDLVRELGGDPDDLLRSVGIDRSNVTRAVTRISFRAMIDLLEKSADRLKCPDFGMRLAVRQGGGKVFGPMGVVMRNSSTLGDALAYVGRHIQAYSLAAGMPMEHDRAAGRVFVGLDILLENIADRSQTVEQHLLLAHYNAVEITAGRARVRQVRFRHQPLSPLRTYRDHFGCEVLFEQPSDGIVFSQDDLNAPIVDPDVQHYEIATSFIEANYPPASAPMHARVRGLVMKTLGVSDCRIERIADELCMHPRTLHRRLKWEHKSFEDIKDEVRRDLARYYLERTSVPFTRISEKLGYSETSVLSRSCTRWFGHSPRDVRSRARADPANDPGPVGAK
ncbi:MAG: AraC family transcriptional regulator [Sphingobium sp.]